MEVFERLRESLSDRYHIERELGAGGMATVYLARDLRHKRRVALKVLHPELSAVLGPDRFLQEIELTASLQHPHILPLFDSGAADGLLFYVMPYVEGESLRTRLERQGPLPVEEAIRLTREVAGALQYAHGRGLVHRDIKPENILLQEGQALLSDFGIALAVQTAGSGRMTQTGLSLGTPQYMAPEQVMGERTMDARADVYALGTVTYEMLAGDPPFSGANTAAVLSRVLTERPRSLRLIRPQVPDHVDAAVEGALEKLPADRWQTATEYVEALARVRQPPIAARSGASGGGNVGPRARWLRRVVTILPWLGMGVLGVVLLLETGGTTRPSQLVLTFEDSVTPLGSVGSAVALSADGSLLAFVGRTRGVSGILVRPLESLNATLVAGTEGGSAPSFSPDGQSILFLQGTSLRKVPTTGGTPVTVADSASAGATWGDNGEILYVHGGSLWRVPEDAGTPVLVAAPDGARNHLNYAWPYFLPGGKTALITIWKTAGVLRADTDTDEVELGIVSLEDGSVTALGVSGAAPRYLDGNLLFVRSNGGVFSAPLSIRGRRLEGNARQVLEGVGVGTGGTVSFAVAANGTVVFREASQAERGLVAVSRSGDVRPLTGAAGPLFFPRVSIDSRRVALMAGPNDDVGDVWIYDVPSTTIAPLTTGGKSTRPEWSTDGRQIFYLSDEPQGRVVRSMPWDRSAAGELFLQLPDSLAQSAIYEVAVGPPGSFVSVRLGRGAGADLWVAPLGSRKALHPVAVTPTEREHSARISGDGRLIAYVTTTSGRSQVFISPLSGPSGRIPVSGVGGTEPVWSRDGTELFYRTSTHLMAARISQSPDLQVVSRDTLFRDTYVRGEGPANYDVLPGDREFLMLQTLRPGNPRYRILLNWKQKL